jgi:hypothetical protein
MKRMLTILGVAVLSACLCVPATAKGPKGPKGNNGNHYGWYKGNKGFPAYYYGNAPYGYAPYSYGPYTYGPNSFVSPWGGYYAPYGYNAGYVPNYSWFGDYWFDD